MDRSNSCDSNSSSVGKTLEKPPPLFKLYFSKDRLVGKSNVCISRINGGDSITPKFYSKEYDNTVNDLNTVDTHHEGSTEEEENGCKDTRRRPLLTSHAYGWWHERGGIQRLDSRFDFRKKTSDLVILGVKLYSEDRKLTRC
ncbi:hypothetical protein WH47_10805 [Habropoda laboriosa]|uniref:Uncharacterized protein n=1 Tax=Habropoda laboriosa TaxID=597456 RepID=A0A0L7RCV1_9HYME|nr:PREDICTED: uncharacterized protein LOC108579301 [Habropoda laboriosa]KOC68817.1 hypothetical protein WH47_10805 [Habropoda laboriosa]